MQTTEGIVRDALRLVVWYPLRWLVEALPAGRGIAVLRTMGDLHYSFSRRKKRSIGRNLQSMKVAEADSTNIMREYFRNHYIDRLLIFIFPGFGPGEIEELVEIEGLDMLDEALEKGSGVILVHGHFGPVHLPLVVLARLGYRMKQIGLPSDEGLSRIGRKVAFRLRLRYEARIPAEIIRADGFLRDAFRWLKDNGVIMITGDGSGTPKLVGKHHTFDFLGHKRLFPLGPAILSAKTGAVIMPIFIVPGGRKLYKIVIEGPLASTGEGEGGILDIEGQFIRRLERYVSQFPAYMHFLDRLGEWKSEPEGGAD